MKNAASSFAIWMFARIGVPPKSSILIGFSIINYPFLGVPQILGNTQIGVGGFNDFLNL